MWKGTCFEKVGECHKFLREWVMYDRRLRSSIAGCLGRRGAGTVTGDAEPVEEEACRAAKKMHEDEP